MAPKLVAIATVGQYWTLLVKCVKMIRMDPSPPKSLRSKKQFHRPFYESPKKTSAEIISEARSSVKSLETKRPFTPADGRRRLFGSAKSRDTRPPSVISIASSYTDSRPPTGRLTPLEATPEGVTNGYLSNDENDLDINENVSKDFRKPSFKEALLPTSPDIFEKPLRKSNSASPKTSSDMLIDKDSRRVQSGPKERTPLGKIEKDCLLRSSSVNSLDTFKSLSKESVTVTSTLDKNLIYFEENLKPLLQQMKLNQLHEDIDSLVINFDMLWKTLEIGCLFGKSKLGNKRRSEVLSVAYQCTPNENPQLQLKLAKIFIAMEVSGKNLGLACKLIFKASRDKSNDKYFIEDNMIGMIVSLMSNSSIGDVPECLVYLIGAIKFLSLNEKSMKELLNSDLIRHLAVLLSLLEGKDAVVSTQQELNNIMTQVVELLNNIVSRSSITKQLIDLNILDHIVSLSQQFVQDAEYSLSVARLLSKLSLNIDVCTNLSKENHLNFTIEILKKNYKKQELAVRMCYMFGNLANLNEEIRNNISSHKDVFLNVLVNYFQELVKIHTEKKDGSKNTHDIEDTLVKTVRVFANVSIESGVGRVFADDKTLIDVLLNLAESSLKWKFGNELLVTIAAATNNLSYFMNQTYLCQKQVEFTDALIKILFVDSMECVLEVVRVLGNFTQTKIVRQRVIANKVFEVLISLLDANNGELIFATCGVLINMMVDKENRTLLKQYGGIANLVDCLKDLAESDWQLAGMICQIFWNYSEFISSSVECFGEDNSDDLIAMLSELTDEETAFTVDKPADTSHCVAKEAWKNQFLPVATLLLERLERHHCMLEPIVTEPD